MGDYILKKANMADLIESGEKGKENSGLVVTEAMILETLYFFEGEGLIFDRNKAECFLEGLLDAT